jgi:regulator of protease activity HflC (stomatin/prohibitin superfamily)
MIAILIALIVVVVAVLAGAATSIKIVREYQRVVLFRLGRSSGARGPGLILLNPITDRVSWVDLREQYLEIPHQTAITADNASIAIDFIIFYKVIDPTASVVAVADFRGAALNIAATTLRSVVGDLSLDDVLSKREDMNSVLRIKLDDVTERWGVKVTNVEVREINPPPSVQEAMTRQMSAERTRRAVVTESEGTKQAAITVAEGQKQSSILSAEGDRQSAILQAEGLALALAQIAQAAEGLDANTMSLQYLEALKKLGSSPATKLVVPMELTGLLSGLTGPLHQSLGSGNPNRAAHQPTGTPVESNGTPIVSNGAPIESNGNASRSNGIADLPPGGTADLPPGGSADLPSAMADVPGEAAGPHGTPTGLDA